MTAEAVFVGLWAPTLDLLYVMFVVTFKPFERRAAVAPRSTERAVATRAPLAAV
jgi:hypothetical protein